MNFLDRERIVSLLTESDLMACIAEGFIAYSHGQALIPPLREWNLNPHREISI